MFLKFIQSEDFINYKKPSMFIGFPYCDFKCGKDVCQNKNLRKEDNISISLDNIIKHYMDNEITSSICIGGLEPFDSFEQLHLLISEFRKNTLDDIVIYSGYYKSEISDKIKIISNYPNIIVKFGRYKPNMESHYDNILGVTLASSNQYAERIS